MISTQEYLIKGLITEEIDENESRIKKVLMDFYNIVDGTFSFGTGIGAFLGPVRQLLTGEDPTMGENQIILLYITAMWLVLRRHSDKTSALLQIIKNEGLMPAFAKVTDFIRSLEDISLKITDEVGYTVSSLADVTAFTFFAMPLLDIINQLISTNTINLENGGGYLKSALISVGVIGAKNVFNILIDRLKGRLKRLGNDKLNEDVTDSLNKKKLRVKTIFEDDNWEYIWPVDDYSFCELSKETDWCKDGKVIGGFGHAQQTPYILKDKNSTEQFIFLDSGKIPGLPSGDAVIKDSSSNWKNMHRFLADKPSLHDMFRQKYSTFELMKYGVKLDPNILEDYSKTNKFAEAVYRMIYYPNSEKEEELSTDEFIGDKFSVNENVVAGWAAPNTIGFSNDGVSLYLPDDIFKEKYMGVDEDEEWYFEMGTDRHHYDDHCEEMDSEELQYIGYHINADNKKKLNNLITAFGKNPDDYPWIDEGVLDEMMEEVVPNIWDNEAWELLDAIGCSVGRARAQQMKESLEEDKVLEYSYEGGRNYLWKIDITYTQLLYIIGDKKISNFSELEDTEVNHIDGGLQDAWYDAWDMDEEGLSDFNYALNSIIDKSTEYIGDDVETILNNREKYEQIIKDLGFTKKYNNSQFEKTLKADGGELDGSPNPQLKGEKRITIISYDPKLDVVDFQVSGPNYLNKRHRTPLDQLSDYAVSKELF